MLPHAETYEFIGAVAGWVDDLERRWQEEDARARVRVAPEESVLGTSYEVEAPPQTAWEFLTTPGRRVQWQAGVTDVIEEAPGNRRSIGTTNHCMHGKDAIIEEVLDWRPYDYFTMRSTIGTPLGAVKVIGTFELEPTTTGTRVDVRFAKPKGLKDRAMLSQMRPIFEGMIDAGAAAIRTLVATEARSRAEAAGAEPVLPAPKPGGVLAGIEPVGVGA
jgi:carbon monoxide dehydrogenase subunit G